MNQLTAIIVVQFVAAVALIGSAGAASYKLAVRSRQDKINEAIVEHMRYHLKQGSTIKARDPFGLILQPMADGTIFGGLDIKAPAQPVHGFEADKATPDKPKVI